MEYLIYWLDRGGWIAQLQHAWIWVSLTAVLSVASIAGIAALARRYDGDNTPSSSTHA